MEITKIQNIVMSSLLVAALAGCSNSSTISHDDSSPWKAKRDAATANAASTEFVEVSLDEAVQVNSMEQAPVTEAAITEPEMMQSEMAAQPELETVAEFNPEPVPVESLSAFERLEQQESMPVAAPEVAEMDTASTSNLAGVDIMSAPSSAYAVQVYAGRKLANVNRYISSHGLVNMQTVKTQQGGEVLYVLVSIHADRQSAMQALNDLEQKTGSKPWLRSVAGLQSIAVQ